MKVFLVSIVLLPFLGLVASLWAAAQVKIWGPPVGFSASAFDVQAEIAGCLPRRWEWSIEHGKIITAQGPKATVECKQDCTIIATAIGGGCAGAKGSVAVEVVTRPGEVECCLSGPGKVISMGAHSWYYQPSIASTGRTEVRLITRTWVETCRECKN